jgi:1-acyl-sn-glycerol-3-phosphate acyltransferase
MSLRLKKYLAALRLPWVLLAALFWLLQGYATMRWVFPRASVQRRQALTQAWARRLLRVFRVRVEVQVQVQVQVQGQGQGQLPQSGPLLLAANHISWLDILLLLAACPVQFIARIENKHWPILGWMSQQAGAVFVQRSSARDMARVLAQVSDDLQKNGGIIALFPEGKTSNGEAVDTFHGNMLQAAIEAACPVQAVALDYRLAATGARSTAVSYASPLNFAQSLINTLASGPYVARLQFAPSLPTQGHSRKHLAAQLRQQIVQMRA